MGNATAKNLENGTSALFVYDNAHRLTAIEHRKGLDLLASFAYTLDSVGNRKSKTLGGTASVPSVESYSYDAVDQIIQAKYGTARTVNYTYDASGNRQVVSENATSQNYTANALNQYTSVGGSPLTYDANGNLTSSLLNTENGTLNTSSYAYDAQNRLVQATVNGIATTFAYDPRNRVVQRTANGTITNLTYDGWNLIEESDSAGALQQVYVHGAAVDELLTKINTAGTVYYHADGLGSTVALTNETGAVVESTTYDAFGAAAIRDASGLSLHVSGFQNRFLFTGRELISEAGIYDYRNRVYSPTLGRFLQTDPIRFAAGDGNIYRYCGNSATNRRDPFGLWSLNDCASDFSNLGGDFKFTPPGGSGTGGKGGGGGGRGGGGGGTTIEGGLEGGGGGGVADLVDSAIERSSLFEKLTGSSGRNVDQDQRYIDTEKLVTIDLQHVISAAEGPPGSPTVGGLMVEINQMIHDSGSAFKTEDIVSNVLGGVARDASRRENTSVGTQVEKNARNAGMLGIPHGRD